jgi:hypothetical protein
LPKKGAVLAQLNLQVRNMHGAYIAITCKGERSGNAGGLSHCKRDGDDT